MLDGVVLVDMPTCIQNVHTHIYICIRIRYIAILYTYMIHAHMYVYIYIYIAGPSGFMLQAVTSGLTLDGPCGDAGKIQMPGGLWQGPIHRTGLGS